MRPRCSRAGCKAKQSWSVFKGGPVPWDALQEDPEAGSGMEFRLGNVS